MLNLGELEIMNSCTALLMNNNNENTINTNTCDIESPINMICLSRNSDL